MSRAQDVATQAIKDIFGQNESFDEAAAKAPSSFAKEIIRFDESGDAVDLGRRTVVRAGFSAGCFVQHQTKVVDSRADLTGLEQFLVNSINNDGSALLRGIDRNGNEMEGQLVPVPMDDFLGTYKRATDRIESDRRGPMSQSPEFQGGLHQIAVFMAMYKKSVAYADEGAVHIQLKPFRRTVASRAFSSGAAMGIPLCGPKQVSMIDEDKPKDCNFFATLTTEEGEITKFNLAATPSKEYISWPFSLKVVDEKDKANAEIVGTQQAVPMWAITGVPKMQVTLPSIVATKDIKIDDEVILFVASAPKAQGKRIAKDVFDVDGQDDKQGKKRYTKQAKKAQKKPGSK